MRHLFRMMLGANLKSTIIVLGKRSHTTCPSHFIFLKLLDLFPEEGGQKGKKHPRLIPYLPGKNYSKFLKNRDVAEKRLPELHRYSRYSDATHTRVLHGIFFWGGGGGGGGKPRTRPPCVEYCSCGRGTTILENKWEV